MKQLTARDMAQIAIVAAIYIVLTITPPLNAMAYYGYQFRVSEMMNFLAFYNKNYIPGLTIGCVIANMFSPFGMLDIIFGTISTILVCLAMYKVNNKYLAAFIGAIITGIIIGGELWYTYQIPYLINALYVATGELFVLIIGSLIFNILEHNERFINLFMK